MRCLSRSIINVIAVAIAVITVKGVNQVGPVANLVSGDATSAEGGVTSSGGRPGAHDATINVEVVSLRVVGWVVAVARVASTDIGDVVEVKCAEVSLAESALHSHLITVVGPVVVDSPVNVLQTELETSTLEILVENLHLLVEGITL